MKSYRISATSRRGSTYLMAVGASLLVTSLSLGSLAMVRVQRQSVVLSEDHSNARWSAHAGMQLALLNIKNDTKWRQNYPTGAWHSDKPLDRGKFTVTAADLVAGTGGNNIADSAYEPLLLTVEGKAGRCVFREQITLVNAHKPLAFLQSPMYAMQDIDVQSGATLTVSGAAMIAAEEVLGAGLITGNVQCNGIDNPARVVGVIKTPQTILPPPAEDVFAAYIARATQIPFASTIEKCVLAPGYNSLGTGTNAEGIYYIDTSGNGLTIKGARIYGTLIVKCAGQTLTLDDAVFMHPYRKDHPTLMVDGALELKLKTTLNNVLELTWGTNFNPTRAPYNGVGDIDVLDSYPNEIQGLVHVTQNATLSETARLRGALFCEKSIIVKGLNQAIYSSTPYDNVPLGYIQEGNVRLVPGSRRQTAQ